MAKLCPVTGEKILYTECVECEDRRKCKSQTRQTDTLNRDRELANLGLKPKKPLSTRSLDEKICEEYTRVADKTRTPLCNEYKLRV